MSAVNVTDLLNRTHSLSNLSGGWTGFDLVSTASAVFYAVSWGLYSFCELCVVVVDRTA